MFKKKSLISMFIAAVLFAVSLFLPITSKLNAFANNNFDYSLVEGELLEIGYHTDSIIELKTGESFHLRSIVNSETTESKVWTPDGKVYIDWTLQDEIRFDEIGLFALQYRDVAISNGVYTYSSTFYIKVSNTEYSFSLNNQIPNKILAGSSFKVPTGEFVYNHVTTEAEVRVFNPYGEEIVLSELSFVPSAEVLGNYYIEYSALIDNKIEKEFYIVEIVSSLHIPTDFTINIGNKEGEIDHKPTIDAFRFYNLSNVIVVSNSAELVNKEIFVSIKNVASGKYFDYSLANGWMEYESQTFHNINDSDLSKFSISDISSLRNKGFGEKGNNFEFTYKVVTAYGTEIVKTVTKSLVFNDKIFSIKLHGYVPTKINATIDSTLSTSVSAERQTLLLPGFDIVINSAFDANSVFANLNFLKKASITSDGSISPVGNGFSLSYPEKIRSSYSFTLKYTISYNDKAVDPEVASYSAEMLTKSISVTGFNSDDLKPNNIKLSNFNPVHIIGKGEYLLPNASAAFFYDMNSSTFDSLTDNNFEVYINNELQQNLLPGQETAALNQVGVYKITYKAIGYYGSAREYDFYVNATTGQDIVNPDYLSFTLKDGKLTITNSVFDFAYVYGSDGNPVLCDIEFSSYGFVKSISINLDGKDYYLVLGTKSGSSSIFKTIILKESSSVSSQSEIKPISKSIQNKVITDKTVSLVENGTIEISVGQPVGMPNFSIILKETSDNYYISKKSITFTKAGNYNFSDGVNNYLVKVSDKSVYELRFTNSFAPFIEKNSIFEIPNGTLENTFGYSVALIIQKANGLVVDETDLVGSVDNYTITYKVTLPNSIIKNFVYNLSSGNIKKPIISVSGAYKNIVYTGEKITVDVLSATATDKNNKTISSVNISVYDPNGKTVEIKNSKFSIDTTGSYTIYYTAIDSDGISNVEKIVFTVEYPTPSVKEDKLTAGQIVGIVVGSVVGAGILTLVVLYVVKKKGINKSFNKKRQNTKKTDKNITIFSVAPSKDGKLWFVKKNTRMFLKCKTKDEAVEKAKQSFLSGDEIKVYNKAGRLIDNIK